MFNEVVSDDGFKEVVLHIFCTCSVDFLYVYISDVFKSYNRVFKTSTNGVSIFNR